MTVEAAPRTFDAQAIRPFRPEDRAAIIEIKNADRPAHQRGTVEEWEAQDALRTGREVFLRLVVGEPAVAYLSITDWSTLPGPTPGVCGFGLIVASTHRRQGIGGLLYERALGFAAERQARRLVTWFTERGPDEPAVGFLTRRGFAEQEREQPSYLDLTAFDASRFAGAIEKAERHGVRILSYADVPNTEENRRRLYRLWMPIERDMPRNDTDPYEDEPFDHWAKQMDRPEWDPRAVILAEVGGEWIGLTQLAFQQRTNIGWTWITGVLPAYRGRGIATALKLRVIEVAKARGCTVITTENHTDNGPMLAINRKLGFVPDPPNVCYNKVLREPEA